MTKRSRTTSGSQQRGKQKKKKSTQKTINFASQKNIGSSNILGNVALESAGGAAGRLAYNALPTMQAAPAPVINDMLQMQALEDVAMLEEMDLFAAGLSAPEVAAATTSMFTGVGEAALLAGAVALGGYAVSRMFDQKHITPYPSLMSVSYQGGIAKKGQGSITVRNKHQKRGAAVVQETYGYIQDPDMVGVGHVSWSTEAVKRAIGLALLRKLLLKAGCQVATADETLELISINPDQSGPDGFELRWEMQNVNTTSFGSYNIQAGISLNACYEASIANVIGDAIVGQNPTFITKIALFQKNGTAERIAAQMNLRQEKIELDVSVHTVIQNRTRAASGAAGAGSTSTTVIDAQPLKGPVFEFTGIPKTKMAGAQNFNIAYEKGVILFRKGSLGANDQAAWAEPPIKKAFTNAKRSAYVRLAPGILKDMEISKEWYGIYDSVMTKMRCVTAQGTDFYVPGRAQVVFLEEELNSGSNNKIEVHYETQITAGCTFTTVKSPNMQPYYSVGTQNNF